MAIVDTIHLSFAGLWAGSVLFVAWGLVPLARDGEVNAAPLERLLGRFRTGSRIASVVLLATGGHLAGSRYTVETLSGTTRGYLVVAMVVLWLALTGLIEVGTGRFLDGLEDRTVRTPAREATPFLTAAALVAVALLVVGGVLV